MRPSTRMVVFKKSTKDDFLSILESGAADPTFFFRETFDNLNEWTVPVPNNVTLSNGILALATSDFSNCIYRTFKTGALINLRVEIDLVDDGLFEFYYGYLQTQVAPSWRLTYASNKVNSGNVRSVSSGAIYNVAQNFSGSTFFTYNSTRKLRHIIWFETNGNVNHKVFDLATYTLIADLNRVNPNIASNPAVIGLANCRGVSEIRLYTSNLYQSNKTYQVIPYTNSAIFYSPYNWHFTETKAISVNPGAYCKFIFTGTSIGINLDEIEQGLTMPINLSWQIDGDSVVTKLLPEFSPRFLQLAQNLLPGTHSITIWFSSVGNYTVERFTVNAISGRNCLRVTGFNIDQNAAIYYPNILPKRAIFFGDSITEQAVPGLSLESFAAVLANKIGDLEYGQVGFSYQGWGGMLTSTQVPDLAGSYNLLITGVSRIFTPQPDYIFIHEGRNDAEIWGTSDATINAKMQTVLSGLRNACPTAKIFVIVPFSQGKKAAITSGFNTYQVTPDSNCYLVDLGTSGQAAVASPLSNDNVHPNKEGAIYVANLIYSAISTNL